MPKDFECAGGTRGNLRDRDALRAFSARPAGVSGGAAFRSQVDAQWRAPGASGSFDGHAIPHRLARDCSSWKWIGGRELGEILRAGGAE